MQLSLPASAWPPSPVLLPPPESVFSQDSQHVLSKKSKRDESPKHEQRAEKEGSHKKKKVEASDISMEIDENSITKNTYNLFGHNNNNSNDSKNDTNSPKNSQNKLSAYPRLEPTSPFVPNAVPTSQSAPVTTFCVPSSEQTTSPATNTIPSNATTSDFMIDEREEQQNAVYKSRNDPNYNFEITLLPRSEKVALLVARAKKAMAQNGLTIDTSKFDLDLKGVHGCRPFFFPIFFSIFFFLFVSYYSIFAINCLIVRIRSEESTTGACHACQTESRH
jgi:hypothetical protein